MGNENIIATGPTKGVIAGSTAEGIAAAVALDLIMAFSAMNQLMEAAHLDGVVAIRADDAIASTFGCDACAFAGGLAVLDDQFSVQRDGLCSLTAGRRNDDRKDQFV